MDTIYKQLLLLQFNLVLILRDKNLVRMIRMYLKGRIIMSSLV